ncbi:MAG: SLC13 family permease, partial [Desulfovibrionaceae bacterium]|nr:SLC13 family permease [Desulfovibrionaceae bacterium]
MEKAAPAKPNIAMRVHTIIGLVIMFSGYFLPNLTKLVPANDKLIAMGLQAVDGNVLISVTDIGMIIAMTFFGVVYLWTFVDTVWPGILGVIAIIISGYAPAPKILSMLMGNPMVVMIFFLCIFAGAIIYSGLSQWLAKFLMTREFVNGRPWVFTATLLISTYIIAFFDQTASCFLMWPVLFSVFEQVGYKKGDKYVSVMVVNICIMALLSFASDPFKGGAFYLLSNLQVLSTNNPGLNAPVLNILAYLGFGVIISLISIALILLVMRYVYRVDVSPLATLDMEFLKKDPLQPMNGTQKTVLLTFLGYALWLLLPSIIGTDNVVGHFLHKNHMSGSLFAVLAISVICIKGKPAVDIMKSNAYFPWRVFLLIAVAMLLGGLMTSKETNVAVYMEYVLRDFLDGMNFTMLSIAVATLGIVLTNFCNSVVLGLMLTPVLIAVANAFGYSSGPMLACFIYAVLIAACTPAASPFAALLFGNTKWADAGQLCKYAVIASAIILGVVIVVGMP